MAMDPHALNVLYAGTGEGNFASDSYYGNGILKTTDGGITWSLLANTTFSMSRFCRIVVNPSTPSIVFAALGSGGTASGVHRSTDGGVTWTEMTNGLPTFTFEGATDVVFDRMNTNIVYAAFWGNGIYKTTNANAVTPTWTKLTTGLPSSGFTRIALGISWSSPQTLYALMSGPDDPNPALRYLVNQLYRTIDGGTTWNSIALPGGNIGKQGFYNLNVAVDHTTPDIVYLSAVSLFKATRNAITSTWTFTDTGRTIHADNHAFAIDPTNHLIIYAGTDGGIYRSNDGGATWDDSLNKGFCITQFEFMDQHPSSDAFVIAGTQDNGTEPFCNDPVFKHMDDGDGGFTAINPEDPSIVYHDYLEASPTRSMLGGRLFSWMDIRSGLGCTTSLFYAPLALDQTNPNNIAFGCDKITIDQAGGTSGWPIDVILPSLGGDLVSAINYVNSNQIYAGTLGGKVYLLTRSGTVWTATAVHATPLPNKYIWDISVTPDFVVVVMSGFGTSHVWRGIITQAGPFAWSDISGTPPARLPDIPVNALVIEPDSNNIYYVGTDIGVFRTLDGGTKWSNFSEGLPNCAVYDMRLHNPTRLLRAVTHGRGMWERKLDVASMPDVDIFVRDHLMDTGRFTPSPGPTFAAFEDPTQHVSLGDQLYRWMCADIKIDALEGESFQIPNVADVDYVVFESKLRHHKPISGTTNRVYVQVHNRGIHYAHDVHVKVLYRNASAGLPPLPPDFWTVFPGDSADTTHWKPIGTTKILNSVSPTVPGILEWDWVTSIPDHACLLVVIDSPSDDPIPSANKVFDVNILGVNEKHVGFKNLHPVQGLVGTMYWTKFQFFGNPELHYTIRISPTVKEWSIGLMFQKSEHVEVDVEGVTVKEPTQTMLFALKKKIGKEIEKYDTSNVYMVDDTAKGGTLKGMKLPENGLESMLLFVPPNDTVLDGTVSIELSHDDQGIVGGSTFVLSTIK
jgi:photosystem II stability/assembly factor-like uncharacterized protein